MDSSGPLFKSVKRRKFIRKRPAEDSTLDSIPTASQREPASSSLPTSGDAARPSAEQSDAAPLGSDLREEREEQEEDAVLADILRRKALDRRRKALGIEFTPESGSAEHSRPPSSLDVAKPGEEDDSIPAISNRFVALTGQKVDVDEHMMLYIESQLAKRRQGLDDQTSDNKDSSLKPSTTAATFTSPPQTSIAPRQAATLGKLHEVDLGPETKLQNITRTEAAARRLIGDDSALAELGEPSSDRRDGKNWKGRKRRTSEDIKRDQLVEEVLRESKLDVYDEPDAAMPNEDDLAADDRIAEQFRRDFMDAIRSRRRRTKTATKGAAAGKKAEPARGPKLGGSRSARAAMRQKEAQQQK
ncbi:hypothetical protein KEM56_003873 [Ascosphaera pollenicola]|nr:hypothetical protein KEM56_003873 [Ascosphaera pollenicola]